MNTKILTLAFCLTACLLACITGNGYEQDNWYLANEWSVDNPRGVAYYEDNTTNVGQIYVCIGERENSRISVYDMNGSLDRNITIADHRYDAFDLVLDDTGNIYIGERKCVTCISNDGTFKWRKGKGSSISSAGSQGSEDGEFDYAYGITIGPDNHLYVADKANHRVQVLDKNGSFLRKFGTYGDAPGQFIGTRDLEFLPDGRVVVTDDRRLHWFESNGNFLKRERQDAGYLEPTRLSISPSGNILTFCKYIPGSTISTQYWMHLLDSEGQVIQKLTGIFNQHQRVTTTFTPNGDFVCIMSGKIRIFKRAYRTKGLPVHNVIPQPAIRKISQRSGTNVLDLDFEIIDSDDTNATVGILAYAEDTRIVPQAWTDGTGSKIGTPIATNQVHRVSWDVKQDWAENTGTIKFEILCQDANRSKPLDIHFLKLPLADGNLTISRSPLKDSDYLNFFKYQVGIGSNEVAWDASSNSWTDGDATTYFNSSNQVTADGRTYLMTKLGYRYRYATSTELTKAQEAATPSSVNKWDPNRPIKPRSLPHKVNEYGFDSAAYNRGWWVVKE